MFMQQKDLLQIAKRLKIQVNPTDKKIIIVNQMKSFMVATETQYRREGKTDKIFFYAYEPIHSV